MCMSSERAWAILQAEQQGSQGTLLERWTLSYSANQPGSSTVGSRAVLDTAAVYKRLVSEVAGQAAAGSSQYCYGKVMQIYLLFATIDDTVPAAAKPTCQPLDVCGW